MKRIKGRYVATVIINLDFPSDMWPISFEEIRKNIYKDTSADIKELIEENITLLGTVEVHQQLADLYEVEVEE